MTSFIGNERGAISLMFGFLLIPLLLIVGAAVDYSRMTQVENDLLAAADLSAVAAVTDPHNAKTAEELKRTAESIFRINARVDPSDLNIAFDVAVTVDKDTAKRVSLVSFSAEVPTIFMKLAGKAKMQVSGTATASSGLPPDTDFFFLLDTSDSMGLAATEDARRDLIRLSKENGGESCEFACHALRGGSQTLLKIARSHNLKLRIDVARDGILRIVDMAEAAAARDRVINRYALTSFSSKMVTARELTSDVAAFKKSVAAVDLGYGMGTALADTLWEKTTPAYLTELERLGRVGHGLNTDKVVVLITDGLRSQDGGGGKDALGRPLIRPFDLDQCEAIKKKGYKLAVVYTMYYDIPYNAWYKTYVRPIRKDLETNLEACATPGLFGVGDTPEELDEAFQKIFRNVRRNPHITS